MNHEPQETVTGDSVKGRRLRVAKGRRPWFFKNPESDQLVAMVVALASELATLRDRVDAHERLMEKEKEFSKKAVDAFEPSEAVAQERDEWHADYLNRIFRILQSEIDDVAKLAGEKEYRDVVKSVTR